MLLQLPNLQLTINTDTTKITQLIFFTEIQLTIPSINKDFLNHYYLTDVITFDRSGRDVIKGDVFICPEVVFENALHYQVSRRNEMYRVMIHGILHLLGYQDHTEDLKQEMRQKENLYLSLGDQKNYLVRDDQNNI